MVRGVKGGWAGQRWADTREGQSREQGLWSGLTGGFRIRVWAAQLPATAGRPFLSMAGGLSHSPSRQRRPRGFGQACSTCILVPSLLHFANAHITQFPWRPASLREGSVGGTLRKDSGKGTARVRAEGNTQEGGSAAWFCGRLVVSGAPRPVHVCPLLIPRRWRGGDATRPSPANTLALRHTA